MRVRFLVSHLKPGRGTLAHLLSHVWTLDALKTSKDTVLIQMGSVASFCFCLLHRADWASQRPTGFNRISSCSNLRPISWLLQWWSQAVLFLTCLRCSLIESLLQSAGRLAFWYNVIAVSYLQTLIPRLNHTCSRGGKPLSALHKRTLAFAKYRTLLSSRATAQHHQQNQPVCHYSYSALHKTSPGILHQEEDKNVLYLTKSKDVYRHQDMNTRN